MKRKIILRISISTAFLLILFSFALPQRVMAQAGPTYSWIWKVDFVGKNTQASLILHERQKGVVVKEVLIDFSKTCHPVGSVPIQNGTAHFNGNGYIECELPNVANAFATHYGVQMPSTVTSGSAWASADIVGPTVGPIFSYDTLSFDVQFQSDFATSTLGLNGMPYQQTYQGMNYSQPGQTHQLLVGNQVEALLDHVWSYPTLGTWAQSYQQLPFVQPNTFPSQHLVYLNNGNWQGTTQQIRPVTFTTKRTFLYIGFNPSTGQLLDGNLKSVGADPGCRCH